MTRKLTLLLGLCAFAALPVVGCAGDGADDGASGNGGSSSGNGGSGSGRGGSGGGSSSNGGSGGGSSSNGGSGGGSTSNGGSGGGSTSNGGSGGGSTSNGGSGGGSSSGGLVTVGGHHTSSTLKGYFWTAADTKGSTITPAKFDAAKPNICVSGKAAKVVGEDYSGTWGAMVGWNVNQKDLPPNPEETVALPTTGKFTVGLSGNVPATVRIKLKVGEKDFCAPIAAPSTTVNVTDLKESCWTSGGAAYAGQPVKDVAIQVVTNPTADVNFDFCVTELTFTP